MILKKYPIYLIVLMLLIFSSCIEDRSNPFDPNGDDYICSDSIPKGTDWTVMAYLDGDNNLEQNLLMDIMEMKEGFVDGQGVNLIILMDRNPNYTTDSSVLGEEFTDARLYRITSNKATRLCGGDIMPESRPFNNYEANMGDANTLKKFIQFSKANYPADKYALFLSNHGSGVRGGFSSSESNYSKEILQIASSKQICVDDTNGGDSLYTAEITDVLTETESVDLIGFDACLMGSVELAYQLHPGNGTFHADVMVASPANEWGYGWKYDDIFRRLRTGGGVNGEIDVVTRDGNSNEKYFDPSTMTAKDFAEIIIEEQYDSTLYAEKNQTFSSYDLSKVKAVKDAVDDLAKKLSVNEYLDGNGKRHYQEIIEGESVRGNYKAVIDLDEKALHYFETTGITPWDGTPFFDLYDILLRIEFYFRGHNEGTTEFNINKSAYTAMTLVDELILFSFAHDEYILAGFEKGKNGIHMFFPDGDSVKSTYESKTNRIWTFQWWFNAIDTRIYGPDKLYGKLLWCIDGSTPNNKIVTNWFELLDSWFDYCNDDTACLRNPQEYIDSDDPQPEFEVDEDGNPNPRYPKSLNGYYW